jgi:hypothetical protein
MNTLFICVAAATLGWQTGYQPLREGGMEYIIQLDEASIESLRGGQPLGSDIPSDIGEVRAFRVVIGAGAPVRKKAPPKPVEKPAPIPLKVAEKAAPPKPAETPIPPSDTPSQPWMPLILTSLALFASIGANLFLGWIAWSFRRRCQIAS